MFDTKDICNSFDCYDEQFIFLMDKKICAILLLAHRTCFNHSSLYNCNVTKFIKSRPISSEVLLENTDNTNYAKYQPIFGKYIKELLLPENYSCQDRPPDDVSSTNGFLFNSSLTVYEFV